MSTPFPHPGQIGPDTLITVKVLFDGQNRRFKLALRDLGAHILPQKLQFLLQIPSASQVRFDRFSDSAGTYVTLDSANPAIYKQLYRAAKAKLKLRLKATVITNKPEECANVEEKANSEGSKRNTYLETVLSNPPTDSVYSFKPFQPNPVITETSQMTEKLASMRMLSRPTIPTLNDFCATTFSIDCNHCGESVTNEHYHCGTCELGDFDLCPACIARGITCDGEDHWLIKRSIRSGKVFASNTETLPPKTKIEPPAATQPSSAVEDDQRTCNSCIIQLAASSFVTCRQCADYDLCFFCLEHGEHGHHPAHTFAPVEATSASVTPYLKTLCQQGRGLKHEAVCDGCDAQIVGVRHKCLSCPDFDYCSACVQVATEVHPGHRFAPLYEQLAMLDARKEVHKSIFCDGPICSARAKLSYIRGDRYKCAICDDTDFCANCEALPSNPHNKTHPLIKLRTPVRHLSVASVNELDNGASTALHGDRPVAKHASTETIKSLSANAATQVQTVAETTPIEHVKEETTEKAAAASSEDLQAWFEHDATPDGTNFAPNRVVNQSWTLRNPGPSAWPPGVAAHFIGGDDMRLLDDKHPSPVSSMNTANRSTVLTAPLEPGKTFTFNVMLKSPAREGRAISYWRLKTAGGLPFGHKLWCDITVTDKSAAKPVAESAAILAEAPVEKEEQQQSNVEAEKSQDSSQMIFPTLEKESPDSSVHDVKEEIVPVEPSVAATEDQDLLDDLESMALEDEDTDDGFMTDEEYDILDAEDEEYLVNAQRAAQK